ncbi:hypothetical protein CCH79_00019609, partial [Gambusia affinis]
ISFSESLTFDPALLPGEACTIVLRGATQQILDEAERSLHDALCVLSQTVKEPRTVYGGGCSEMLMAKVVSDLANRTPGKEAVAMESFAKALRMLPTIIADNAGYDSADLVAQLRAAHQENKTTYGLDMFEGSIGDMATLGITESFQVKRQMLLSASEAAEMILRVDNIIKAAPRNDTDGRAVVRPIFGGLQSSSRASLSMAPVSIFKQGADEEKAETARLSSFIGAIAIGDLVKSTLGPKGMDKILLSGAKGGMVTVTNDGATILKAIGVDNPAAKVLVDMSKVQDDEVGDGTTSVTVLAAELLREAELLIARKLHPQTIIAGWRKATQAAREALREAAADHSNDPDRFQEDLLNIARTTLSSKLLTHHKDHFSKLAVNAIMRLKGSGNLEAIHVIKKLGGSLTDSYLDEGFLLDKKIGVNQPKRLENVKILIANTGMDTDKIKIFGSRVRVDSTAKVAEIEQAEKQKMKEKVDRILKHGINCFINRQLIYNYPEQLFAQAGVMAIEHADFAGVERLALVTGGEITSTFDHPEMVKLGHCKLIEEVMIGEDMLIRFSGVAMGTNI